MHLWFLISGWKLHQIYHSGNACRPRCECSCCCQNSSFLPQLLSVFRMLKQSCKNAVAFRIARNTIALQHTHKFQSQRPNPALGGHAQKQNHPTAPAAQPPLHTAQRNTAKPISCSYCSWSLLSVHQPTSCLPQWADADRRSTQSIYNSRDVRVAF